MGKRRPVLIVSNAAFNRSQGDVVVVPLTSNPAASPFSVMLDASDLSAGSLYRPSLIKAAKLRTLDRRLVAQPFAKLRGSKLAEVHAVLHSILD